ncbi:hypothetical protein SAMN05445756_0582 [Kytococcus aerolatus]|uniref:Uncharacterized protein n=1 Tax=Kytococcus aerolatus TaxID=592308 RepID=A0A212T805_9MICO|nr:PPA1309 family protein [Kytococcus aerolatus]SNC61914.1 hypothetical protein SAMN05445756_0582 [Kytococcus aerolatus]
MTTPPSTPEIAPELLQAARETERHVAESGWGQPDRVFALARTADLVAAEPSLRGQLGDESGYSAVEQELPAGTELVEFLGHTRWPEAVVGCALAAERRMTVPPAQRAAGAGDEPEAIRLLVAVTRQGERVTLLRMEQHDRDTDVAVAHDAARELEDALLVTLGD